MKKNLLIGCLILFVVVVIGGGIAGYFFVYRPASEYVQSFSEMGKVSELDKSIANTESFAPPADNLLTQDEVDRFVRVQRHMVEAMGSELDRLKQKYDAFGKPPEEGGTTPGITDVMGAWKDLSATIVKAKELQVDAMNQESFSKEEYEWVRSSFWQALGTAFVSMNMAKMAEAIQTQNPDVLKEQTSAGEAPAPNQELVKPYQEEAQQWLAYAWLGF